MTKLPCLLLFAGALLASGPALAQNARQRVPPSGSSGGSGGESGSGSSSQGGTAQPRQAVPREEGGRSNPRVERAERAEPARSEPARTEPARVQPSRVPPPVPVTRAPEAPVTRTPQTAATPPVVAAPAPETFGQAVPRGSRPRGDNPPTGEAMRRPPDSRDRGRDTRIYTTPRTYNNYYYYPRRYYPYGYGAFGLGYFYYDPYTWYPGGYYYDPYYPGRPYGYYDRGYRYGIGSLRIEVKPRDAEVYVDGYFAGRVDDFDGTFQALDLEEGPYKIEIVMPGFETLEVNIRIQPGRKITYRGELRRARP